MSRTAHIQDEEEPLQTDQELVDLARRGDAEAFGQLIDRYQQKIYNLTYHMTSNREEAEDLAQEAFLRSYKALDRFRGKSSFYTWLYRIAVNLTLNHL
jgi:RNA polymerase sigma-70 factor (ECF subfamily)